MDILYISDFLYPESLGGAEQNDAVVLEMLENRGHSVEKVRSRKLNIEKLFAHKDKKIIVSNFVRLTEKVKNIITNNFEYIIYEHDHKYLTTRDPSEFENFKAPKHCILNVKFYYGAKSVFVQSNLHEKVIKANLPKVSTYVVGGNCWAEDTLELLSSLNKEPKVEDRASVMWSNISHKNTNGAVRYCEWQEMDYEIIRAADPDEFIRAMTANEYLVFLPKTIETLSRIVCEARMAGCKVITNKNIGATSHDWFDLDGDSLVEVMRGKKEKVIDRIEEIFGDLEE